ncbi:MAG: NlpC/P60 family protein [Pseudomonadota bacterium]
MKKTHATLFIPALLGMSVVVHSVHAVPNNPVAVVSVPVEDVSRQRHRIEVSVHRRAHTQSATRPQTQHSQIQQQAIIQQPLESVVTQPIQQPVVRQPVRHAPEIQQPSVYVQSVPVSIPQVRQPTMRPSAQRVPAPAPVVRPQVVQQPIMRQPVVQVPTVPVPVVRRPIVQQPTVQKQAVQKPVVQRPAPTPQIVARPAPVAQTAPVSSVKPTQHKEAVQETVIQQAVRQKPTQEKSIAQTPVVEAAPVAPSAKKSVEGLPKVTKAKKKKRIPNPFSTRTVRANPSAVVNNARRYLGARYRYGGRTYRGIDCSALVQNSFKSAGVLLPRTSRQQARKGRSVRRQALSKGDLVFFATSGGRRVSHVGIMVDSHSFIHSSRSKGVGISKLSNPYWGPRYLFARRI